MQFSFLTQKFSLWLVDGENPLNNSLTKGFMHTPRAVFVERNAAVIAFTFMA
jgi:hypothetical protein